MQAASRPVYELLLLAALDGTGDLRLIRAIAGERGEDGLGAGERAGLVRADQTTERVTFRHPLIRAAIGRLSTSSQRRRARAKLAARLADQPERHAWHLAEATDGPDERVAALLQEVAHGNLRRRRLGRGGHRAAARGRAQPRPGRTAADAWPRPRCLGSIVTSIWVTPPGCSSRPAAPTPARAARSRPRSRARTTCCTATATSTRAHRLLLTAVEERVDPRDAHDKVLIEALYTLIMICFSAGGPSCGRR